MTSALQKSVEEKKNQLKRHENHRKLLVEQCFIQLNQLPQLSSNSVTQTNSFSLANMHIVSSVSKMIRDRSNSVETKPAPHLQSLTSPSAPQALSSTHSSSILTLIPSVSSSSIYKSANSLDSPSPLIPVLHSEFSTPSLPNQPPVAPVTQAEKLLFDRVKDLTSTVSQLNQTVQLKSSQLGMALTRLQALETLSSNNQLNIEKLDGLQSNNVELQLQLIKQQETFIHTMNEIKFGFQQQIEQIQQVHQQQITLLTCKIDQLSKTVTDMEKKEKKRRRKLRKLNRQSSHSSTSNLPQTLSTVTSGGADIAGKNGPLKVKKNKLSELSKAKSETSRQNQLVKPSGKPKPIIFHKEPKARTIAKSNSKDFEF